MHEGDNPTPRIHPCLWFATEAEAAVEFYVSVFPRSRLLERTFYAGGGRMPEGSLLTIDFELAGQRFTALNGGVLMSHSPAMSLVVTVASQSEADGVFDRLSADESKEQCGWLTDRYGMSWQVVPQALMELLRTGSAAQRRRVFDAVMGMRRINIAALQSAFLAHAS